jgi:hypothetical protein
VLDLDSDKTIDLKVEYFRDLRAAVLEFKIERLAD